MISINYETHCFISVKYETLNFIIPKLLFHFETL
jgi:hypothetical protein